MAGETIQLNHGSNFTCQSHLNIQRLHRVSITTEEQPISFFRLLMSEIELNETLWLLLETKGKKR